MEWRYAGFWIRVAASIVDSLILFIPINGVNYLVFKLLNPGMSYWDTFTGSGFEDFSSWLTYETIRMIFGLMIGIFYYGFLTSKFGGTGGKLLFGLHVVGEDDEFISFARAIGRYFSYILSGFFFVGYIMVAFTKKKQGLHDLICNTYVIKE